MFTSFHTHLSRHSWCWAQPWLRLCLLPLLFSWCTAHAQQQPQYAQYLQNYFLLNPALAGLESYADGRVGYRHQWVGFDNAPRTAYVSAHVPIGNQDFSIEPASPRFSYQHQTTAQPQPHGGVGVKVLSDQAGAFSRLSAQVAGAYHHAFNEDWQLSVGVAGGLTQHLLDFDYIKLANPQDPAWQQGRVTQWKPDLAAGLWLYAPTFYVGFSAQQLVGRRLSFGNSASNNVLVPHYFLTTGYRFDIADDWRLVPSVLLKKSTNQPLSTDVNLKLDYQNKASLGVSYRAKDAAIVWLSGRLAQKFVVSYGYEMTLSGLQTVSGGAHELSLGVTLGSASHYTSPRLFW